MIQKESRLDVADNSGAKVAMVIGTKGVSTARGRFTRVSVGVGDRIICTVKKALPNADIKAGDKVRSSSAPSTPADEPTAATSASTRTRA